MHQCFCKRENCYWHHLEDQFNEEECEDQKQEPWVNGDLQTPSSELPVAGEESREGALPSVQGSI